MGYQKSSVMFVAMVMLPLAWCGQYVSGQAVGWVVGDGAVVRSNDGGNTWINLLPNVGIPAQFAHFESVAFSNTQEGWIAGQGGLMFHTTNGGTSWTQQN